MEMVMVMVMAMVVMVMVNVRIHASTKRWDFFAIDLDEFDSRELCLHGIELGRDGFARRAPSGKMEKVMEMVILTLVMVIVTVMMITRW